MDYPSKAYLDTLGKYVDAGTWYSGYYLKVTGNVGTVTSPIGGKKNGVESWFCGNFDGNGYTIALNLQDKYADMVGLFGMIGPGAVIQNVTVSGVVRGHSMVGGIVGRAFRYGTSNLTIENT